MSDKLCSNGFLLTFYAAIGSWCQSPAWAALLAPTDIRPEQKEDIQTAGWNETLMALFEAYIIIEGLFITHRAITERPQAFAWQTDLIASAVIVSDHSDVAYWYEHLRDYAIIAFSRIKISGQVTKFYLNVDPQVPRSVMWESRVNTELSEPWEDYERHTGHEKHPASSVNHWANERWQVLNSYSWILCTL